MKIAGTLAAGWLLITAVSLSVLSALTQLLPEYWVGVPIWAACLLLLRHVKRPQLKQISVLFGIGAIGMVFGKLNGADNQYLIKALTANQMVVAMLIGVSFLKIIASLSLQSGIVLPRGRVALWRTMLSNHLLGSVINISSLLIIGDRLSAKQPLKPVQGLALLRSFGTAGLWSPFFAAMGLTLVSAPGAQLVVLICVGLPLAAIGMLYSAWEIARNPETPEAEGYPMQIGAFYSPMTLALIVIIAHILWPSISVLTLVTLTAILYTLGWLTLKHGPNDALRSCVRHIHKGLHNLCGEVLLFASAAALASGVAATLASFDLSLAPAHFGLLEAWITLVVLVVVALLGMHPVTSVVLAGSILAPSITDPNLLGLTMLMGWSMGIILSPLSGTQLSLQSRYGLKAMQLFSLNRRYVVVMFTLYTCVLWLYTQVMH